MAYKNDGKEVKDPEAVFVALSPHQLRWLTHAIPLWEATSPTDEEMVKTLSELFAEGYAEARVKQLRAGR